MPDSTLVVGATGPIGRELCEQLARRGDLVYGAARRATHGARHVPLDLAGAWEESSLPKVDRVVHLAQAGDYRNFPDAAASMFAVNVASVARLLDWARRSGVRAFALASSGGLYGPSDAPITEEHPLGGGGALAYYLSTKRAAELLAAPYAPYYSVGIARIFFAYGPGQGRGFLIPSLVRSVRAGTPIKLAGPEGIRLNPITAADAASAMMTLLDGPGLRVANVAGPEALTLRQIGEAIGRALGRAPSFDVDPTARPGHVVADTSRLASLGFTPGERFEAAIARYLATEAPELA